MTIHLHLSSFSAAKIVLKKKIAGGNAHYTNYWIWVERPGPLVVYILLELFIFGENKNLYVKSFSEWLFTAKILLKAMYLAFPPWAQSLTKFNPKIQDIKRVLDLNCK